MTVYKLTFEDGSDGYLAHHGVLGMKWGVRNAETQARYNREKRAGLSIDSRKVAVGAAVAGGILAVAGGVYIAKSTGMLSGSVQAGLRSTEPLREFIDQMDDTSVTLAKGTKLQRIAGSRVEDLATKGELYTSYKLRDNAKYADRLPNESWLRGKDVYKQTLKVSTEVRAPSRREAAEIYLKVAGKDARQMDFQNFMQTGIRTPRPRTNFTVNDLDSSDIMAIHALRQAGYSEQAAAVEAKALAKLRQEWNEGDPLRKPYIAELKKRGYNAVIDENDATWTNKPLLLIEPSAIVGTQKGRKLTAFDKVIATYLK